MSLEPTLPSERTRLAWTRTVLAGVVCLLGVLRLLAEVSVPLVAVIGIAVLLAAVVLGGLVIRRRVRNREMITDTAVGRNAALLTGIVVLACFGAMLYVVLI